MSPQTHLPNQRRSRLGHPVRKAASYNFLKSQEVAKKKFIKFRGWPLWIYIAVETADRITVETADRNHLSDSLLYCCYTDLYYRWDWMIETQRHRDTQSIVLSRLSDRIDDRELLHLIFIHCEGY